MKKQPEPAGSEPGDERWNTVVKKARTHRDIILKQLARIEPFQYLPEKSESRIILERKLMKYTTQINKIPRRERDFIFGRNKAYPKIMLKKFVVEKILAIKPGDNLWADELYKDVFRSNPWAVTHIYGAYEAILAIMNHMGKAPPPGIIFTEGDEKNFSA
jgi:hypothetical protein